MGNIRGALVDSHLKKLLNLQLVKVVGKSEDFGKPNLYGTTEKFLQTFGISKLDDLPNLNELVKIYEE